MSKPEIAMQAALREFMDIYSQTGFTPSPAVVKGLTLSLHDLKQQAINPDSGSDYTLNPAYQSVWITVDSLNVNISRGDNDVTVEIYEKGFEDRDSLASTYAFFNEGGNNADL